MDPVSSANRDFDLLVVTRTLGLRTQALERTIRSVALLKKKYSAKLKIGQVVVFPESVTNVDVSRWEGVLTAKYSSEDIPDTRWIAILKGIQSYEAQYFLFLDDDDWLQIGESFRLAEVILSKKPEQIWLGARLVAKSKLLSFAAFVIGGNLTYKPEYFHSSFSLKLNLTPFPCVIYEAKSLRRRVALLSGISPVFREDHLIFAVEVSASTCILEPTDLFVKILPGEGMRQILRRGRHLELPDELRELIIANQLLVSSRWTKGVVLERIKIGICHLLVTLRG